MKNKTGTKRKPTINQLATTTTTTTSTKDKGLVYFLDYFILKTRASPVDHSVS